MSLDHLSTYKKPIAACACAAALATCCIGGAVAYLQANTATTTNTFAIASLLDPTPLENAATPDGANSNFFLGEHETVRNATTGEYSLASTTKLVMENSYNKLIPNTTNAKDPQVTLDLDADVSAYLFVKVTSENMDGISYSIDSANWTLVDGETDVYYFTGTVANGKNEAGVITSSSTATDVEVDAANILTSNNFSTSSSFNPTGTPSLSFQAYAVQTSGFDSAAAAWTSTYGA